MFAMELWRAQVRRKMTMFCLKNGEFPFKKDEQILKNIEFSAGMGAWMGIRRERVRRRRCRAARRLVVWILR